MLKKLSIITSNQEVGVLTSKTISNKLYLNAYNAFNDNSGSNSLIFELTSNQAKISLYDQDTEIKNNVIELYNNYINIPGNINFSGTINTIINSELNTLSGNDTNIKQYFNDNYTNFENTSNHIRNLDDKFISLNGNTSNYIQNIEYKTSNIQVLESGNIKLNSDLTIVGQLNVSDINITGSSTTINTDSYITENLEINNTDSDGPSLKIDHKATLSHDIIQISNNTTRLFTIDPNGDVGIGISTPPAKLSVNSSTQGDGIFIAKNNALLGGGDSNDHTQLLFWNGSQTYYGRVGESSTIGVLAHNFRINATATTVMRIANIAGVGTSNSTNAVDIKGNLHIEGDYLFIRSNNTTNSDLGKPQIHFSEDAYSSAIASTHLGNIRLIYDGGGQGGDNNYIAFEKRTTGEIYNTLLHITYGGNVGIDNNNPQFKLDVDGDINISSSSSFKIDGNAISTTDTTYTAGIGVEIVGTEIRSTITQYGNSEVETLLNTTGVTGGVKVTNGNLTVNGNIAIGTNDTPIAKLHIPTLDSIGTITDILNFKNTSDYGIYATSTSIAGRGNTLDFKANDYNYNNITTHEILSLKPSGNVGIGNNDPLYKLDIVGDILFSGNFYREQIVSVPSSLSSIYISENEIDSTYKYIKFENDGSNQTNYSLSFTEDTVCSILIIAGGGAGGMREGYNGGGGGGAGEVLELNSITFSAYTNYQIKVGKGGNASSTDSQPSEEGHDTAITHDNVVSENDLSIHLNFENTLTPVVGSITFTGSNYTYELNDPTYSGGKTIKLNTERLISNYSFDTKTYFSIALWWKPNDFTDGRIVFGVGDTFFSHHETQNCFYIDYNGSTAWSLTPDNSLIPDVNTFYHIVFTFNAGIWQTYLNGQALSTPQTGGVFPTPNWNGNFILGGATQQYSVNSRSHANYDNLKIYNKVLSATEVSYLYKITYRTKGGGRGSLGKRHTTHSWPATSGGSGGGGCRGIDNIGASSSKYNDNGHGYSGRDGNHAAGGGGGSGGVGTGNERYGGVGFSSSITGTSITYASGGIGGWQYGQDYTDMGYGSGGGGASSIANEQGLLAGENGNSGVLIIKFAKKNNLIYQPYTDNKVNNLLAIKAGVGITWNTETEKFDCDIVNTDTNTTYDAGSGLTLNGTTFNCDIVNTDTTYTAGTGMSLSGTTFNCDIVNIDTNTTYDAGVGLTLNGTTFNCDIVNTDTTYTAGTGMSLSGTTFNCDIVNIDTNTTYDAGVGLTLNGTTFNCDIVNTDTTYIAGTGITIDGTTINSEITQYTNSDVTSLLNSGVSGGIVSLNDLTVHGNLKTISLGGDGGVPVIIPQVSINNIDSITKTVIFQNTGGIQTQYDITFSTDTICDILIIGGGGSGAQKAKAGAGAGGLVYVHNANIIAGTYNILVGNGGTGNDINSISEHTYRSGNRGFDSKFDNIIALGGGAGLARYHGAINWHGGSGGGGVRNHDQGDQNDLLNIGTSEQSSQNQSVSYTLYQYGNDGMESTWSAAAGGGAGGVGYRIGTHPEQDAMGGIGLSEISETGIDIDFKTHFGISDISIGHHVNENGNDKVYFAAGGGGHISGANTPGQKGGGGGSANYTVNINDNPEVYDALPNTGGGGGGTGNTNHMGGGDGGSGIVIIRFVTSTETIIESYSDDKVKNVISNLDTNIITSGNVGIGTTSPVSKLDVNGDINISSGSDFKIDGTPIATTDTTYSGGNGISINGTIINSTITQYTNSEVSSLLNSGITGGLKVITGNVGIGTTSPGSKLHISTNVNSAANITLLKLTNGTTIPTNDLAGNWDSDISTNIDFDFLDDNANFTPQARIKALNGKKSDDGIDSEGCGNLLFYTSIGNDNAGGGELNEIMRLTYEGNVGIGLSDPNEILHILGNFKIETRDNETSSIDIKSSTGGFKIQYHDSDNNLKFITDNNGTTNDLLIMDRTNNRIGIGIIPNKALDVNGDVNITGTLTTDNLTVTGLTTNINTTSYITENLFINNIDADGPSLKIDHENTNADIIQIFNDSTRLFTIDENGKVGIFNSDPSIELDITGGINFTTSINGITTTELNYLDGTSKNIETNFTNTSNHIDDLDNKFVNDISTLDTKITNNDTYILNTSNHIDALDIKFISDISSLDTKINDNETNILNTSNYIENIEFKTSNIEVLNSGNIKLNSDLTIDNHLIVNDKIGIGTTTSPAYKLDVNGDINFTGQLRKDGDIFTSSSYSDTDVLTLLNTTGLTGGLKVISGDVIVDGGVGVGSSGVLQVRQKGNSNGDGIALTSGFGTSHRIWKDASGTLSIGQTTNSNSYQLRQDINGNVAIGTSIDVNYKLNIGGDINFTGQLRKDGNIFTSYSDTDVLTLLNTTGVTGGIEVTNGNITTYDSLNLFLYGNGNSEKGIFFRSDHSSGSVKYNCSILIYDHGGGVSGSTPDGISINAYDGISFCVGSNTRNEKVRIKHNGNVGIGTTDPQRTLDLSSSGQITFGDNITISTQSGVYWHSNDQYGIYRTNGSWNAPNYQQLMIRWDTGIILNPGSGINAKSHVGVVGGMSIGEAYYTTEHDNGLIVQGNVGIGTTSPYGVLNTNNIITQSDTTIRGWDDVAHNSESLWLGKSHYGVFSDSGTLYDNYFGLSLGTVWSGNSYIQAVQLAQPSHNIPAGAWYHLLLQPNNGYVGIGLTTNPTAKLDVNGDINISSGSDFKIDGTPIATTDTTYSGGNGISINGTIINSTITQYTNSEVSSLLNSGITGGLKVITGNVGIGTSSPSKKLDVNGDANITGTLTTGNLTVTGNTTSINTLTYTTENLEITSTGADGPSLKITHDTTNYDIMEVYNSSSVKVFTIDSSDNVGIGAVSANRHETASVLHIDKSGDGSIQNLLTLRGGTSGQNNGGARIYLGGDNDHFASILSEHTGNGYTYLAFGTANENTLPSERMRIDKDGNVGIGTTTPSGLLHIAKTDIDYTIQDQLILECHNAGQAGNGNAILFKNRWNNYLHWDMARIKAIEQSGYGGALIFETNNGSGTSDTTTVEAMRIDELGNVGIGTNFPKVPLQVGIGTTTSAFTSRSSVAILSGESTGDGTELCALTLINSKTSPAASSGDACSLGFNLHRGWGPSVKINSIRTNNLTQAADLIFLTHSGTALSEKMKICDDGNVGIGISSPGYKLDVDGDINFTGQLRKDGNIFTSYSDTDVLTLLNTTGVTGGLKVTSGNVGIGISSPGYKLDVDGDINFTGQLRKDGNIFTSYSDTDVLTLLNTTGVTGGLKVTSGNVGIGISSPGYKLDVDGDINCTGNFKINGNNFVSNYWSTTSPSTTTSDIFYNDSNTLSGTAYSAGSLVTITGGITDHQLGSALAYKMGLIVEHSNRSQGLGIGYNGISQLGSSDNLHLHLRAKGTGTTQLGSNSGISLHASDSRVGIATTPTYQDAKLSINVGDEGTMLSSPDISQFLWRINSSSIWGMYWATNGSGNNYYIHSDSNPNQIVFVGSGVSRAAIDLDNGAFWSKDWYYLKGNGGIKWEDHGGGWTMDESSTIKVHGTKHVQCTNNLYVDQNVGIGTTSPQRTLDLSTTGQITFGDNITISTQSGVYWHSNDQYGIYRTNGSWNAPNYQQLMIRWDTGIILNPGSASSTKSHVGVVGGMSVGDTYYSTKYDNGIIVQGYVGIGTKTPSTNLDVNGGIKCNSLTVNGVAITANGGGGGSSNDGISITNVGSSTNSGTSISANMGISGSTYAYIDLRTNNNDGGWIDFSSVDNVEFKTRIRGYNNPQKLVFTTGGTYNTTIDATGNLQVPGDITAFFSDERLKHKIESINNVLSILDNIDVFKYENNDLANNLGFKNNKSQIGLSAQEIKKYYPELVELAPFDSEYDIESGGNISKSGENYLTLKYDRLVPVLLQGIKELNNKNKLLEEKNKKIENDLELIKNKLGL